MQGYDGILKDKMRLSKGRSMGSAAAAELLRSLVCSALIVMCCWVNDHSATSLELSKCRTPLGMQNDGIPDHAVSASSSYDSASVGPQNARIHTDRMGGAWCPKNTISRDVYEWLQINLDQLTVITQVETQGRFGNGQGQEYAEAYILEYKRREEGPWVRFRNRTGGEVFPGNINTYTAVLREVNPPIMATKLRIIPYSTHPRTVCLRVELYGCQWKVGILSYNMPQGERRGAEVDLYDFTYDGKIADNYLSGGLGQLTDGDTGQMNFRLDPMNVGKRGYEWVGWKNDTDQTPPVEIIFEFDKVRNFTAARFHTNNMFSKDVRVFRMAKLYFSITGQYYQEKPVIYEYMRDILMVFARQVIIHIPHRIGRYVKVHLYYDARWLMISEVTFDSDIATGNFSAEKKSETLPGRTFMNPSHNSPGDQPDIVEVELVPGEAENNSNNPTSGDNKVDKASKEHKGLDDQFIGIIIGTLAALLLLLVTVVLYVFRRHRINKYANGNVVKTAQPQHVTLNLNDLRALTNGSSNGKLCSNGNVYNSIATSDDLESDREVAMVTAPLVASGKLTNGDVYREPYDGIQGRQLPDLPQLGDPGMSGTDTATSREYAVPDITKSSRPFGGGSKSPFTPLFRDDSPPPPPVPPHPQSLYGGMNTVGIQGSSGNSLYAVPNNMDLLWKEDYSVMEFPLDSLKFVEKLGEGQFGEVHLCEALRITDILGDDFLVNRTGTSRSLLVAVKMLRSNADEQARCDFRKEVKIMCSLKDPNIVRVLGVCTKQEPLCVIVEYMKYGDLNQFLQQHVALESTVARKKSIQALSYGCLIYMANQIASGMKFLENMNMVHRDLATRNCLVGALYTIKISDFGMSRSLYSSDYYRIEGKAVLPIRWMAWESVLLGKFSTKSDVWSFAVTLWEILTFAREQPYDGMSDETVIENCGHFYRNDGQEENLPHTGNCPKEIYDLMRECWNREEVQRPAFREIHMFLHRKNMGYDPRDERQNTPTPTRITVPVV